MAQLLFFGKLGDLAGGRMREMPLSTSNITVAQLIAAIGDDDSVLGNALSDPTVRFIINEQICSSDTVISETDEIAFLPPVSGG